MVADIIAKFGKWLGAVVAVGGTSAAIAYGLFQWLGQRWIEHQFAARLESFKAEQQKELERLKHLLSSRVSRIHEKEFEVLPRAWFLLHDACGKAHEFMATIRQSPDFENLPEPLFEEFLKDSKLSDSQKDELRRADRNARKKVYGEAQFWIEYSDSQKAHTDFHNYLVQHRIFMTDDLRQKFGAVDKDLADALLERRNWKRYGILELFDTSLAKSRDSQRRSLW
jgi:hypothetical protein